MLDTHYQTDLNRLEAIHESGSLLVQLDQRPCPLCGAPPGDQHLDLECEGNTEAVVEAADAEMVKIDRLRRELSDKVASLTRERNELEESLSQFEERYSACEQELSNIAAPALSAERASYEQLVSERAEIRLTLEQINRLRG